MVFGINLKHAMDINRFRIGCKHVHIQLKFGSVGLMHMVDDGAMSIMLGLEHVKGLVVEFDGYTKE